MLRRSTAPREPATAPSTPDVDQIDVTRVTILLDTGVERSFDLEDGDTIVATDAFTTITRGTNVVAMVTPRIVCIERDIVKKNKVRPSGSI